MGFKAGRTNEKVKERNVRRNIDEDGLRKMWKNKKQRKEVLREQMMRMD